MLRALFATAHFEARLEVEVDSRGAVADSSWEPCNDARTENLSNSTLAGSKANNRFPDEVEAEGADRSNRRDSEDMLGSASDAWVASSRAAADAAHIDRADAVLGRHLFRVNRERKNG